MTGQHNESVILYHDEPSYTDHYAKLYDWTWEIPLTPKARTLYAYILYRVGANDEHKAWPSRETIAKATGISERCLHDLLHELEHQGMIRIHAFPARQSRPAEYYAQTKEAVLARQAELRSKAIEQQVVNPLQNLQANDQLQNLQANDQLQNLQGRRRNSCKAGVAIPARPASQKVQRLNKDELDTGKQIHNRDTEEDTLPARARVSEASASLACVFEDQDQNAGDAHPPTNVVSLTGSPQEHATSPEDTALKGEKPKRRYTKKVRSTGGVEGAQMAFPDSLVHDPVEPDDLWAAKEWLSRVFGWEWVASDTLMQWRRWCKPCVEAGGREMFSRFVATKEEHRWIDEDGQDWRERVGKPWFSGKWTAFVNAQRNPTTQPVQGKRSVSRDAGRIDNSQTGTAVIPWCHKCHRKRDQDHTPECKVRLAGHGDKVTADHCNAQWIVDNGFGRQNKTAG